ncbi:MAG TPA: DUF72 domain-containing protein [Pilimelia sp.]|nr:DUF72 domain-containing protein [Pilimelia sp.]
MGTIRVGTSSWADQLLIASGWYPRALNTPAGRLAHYATFFDLVEVDTTYYAIPAVETTAAWVDRTPAGFTFDVKAFRLFTGHPTPSAVLPRDLRPRTGAAMVRRRDLAPAAYDALWDRFRAALAPIDQAGKLGVVLLQFPPWLRRGDAAVRRIAAAVERCRPLRVAVELRHGSWFTDEHVLPTLRFLHDLGASFACVDMPQGDETSVPPVLVATGEPAVVRFHGHSPDWAGGDKQDKFRYAYGDEELRGWADRLRGLADHVDEVHVLLNNCCGEQAPRDAARLVELLDGPAPAGAPGRPMPGGPSRWPDGDRHALSRRAARG